MPAANDKSPRFERFWFRKFQGRRGAGARGRTLHTGNPAAWPEKGVKVPKVKGFLIQTMAEALAEGHPPVRVLRACMGAHGLDAGRSKGEIAAVLRNGGPRAVLAMNDFKAALADAAGKMLVASFTAVAPSWPLWAVATESPRLTGQVLDVVQEGQEYPTIRSEDATREVTLGKRGASVPLTFEMMVSDDLQVFNTELQRLAVAAAAAEDDALIALLASNPSIGGTAFFHADRGNLASGSGVGPPSVSTLATARAALAAQVNAQGHRLNLKPRIILVPPGLGEKTAQMLYTINSALPEEDRWRLLIAPQLGVYTTAWWVFPDPRQLPVAAMVFLKGRRQPELVATSVPDGQLFTLRHPFAASLINPAAGWMNEGA